jgi:uncharacterized NAD(P)/FAD-binding protein YdhS
MIAPAALAAQINGWRLELMRTIAIIGAGFSGTATTVNLLKHALTPVRIVLIDDHPELAGGLAYSAEQRDCLLNVPAAQMSLDTSRPDDLVDFSRRQGMATGAQDFVSRALYGRYLSASPYAPAIGRQPR